MLCIHLLGSFSVDVDGHTVGPWPRKSALHLLQALALSPGYRASRTQLVDVLVPDRGSEQLRAVSDALYALRHQAVIDHSNVTTLADYLRSSPEAIWLDKAKCWVDVTDFEFAADAALSGEPSTEQLASVVARCSGQLLPQIAPPLETWASSLRPILEQKYLACARALVSRHVCEEQSDPAILALQSVLQVAPDDEESHRQLIEIFAKLGRYHEAEQQLALCRLVLARDLGVRPSEATINAIRIAREHRVSVASEKTTAAPQREAIGTPSDHKTYSPPKPLVKLIGRDDALKALPSLLSKDDHARLITMCGVGGVGKTQLALEIASRCAPHFRNGAVFIDLTKVADSRNVDRAIAMSLGIKPLTGRTWRESLVQYVRELNILLVLDNFEHVHSAAPWLVSVIEQCYGLAVLCTSRMPLLVQGEHVYDVPALALGGDGVTSDAPSDAAKLFLRAMRGGEISANYAEREMELIELICRRLDGIPLAIELAAARASVVGISLLSEALAENEMSMRNPVQGVPRRHSSLPQLLASICDVFDQRGRLALQFAAQFEGGFKVRDFVSSELFAKGESEDLLANLLRARVIAIGTQSQVTSSTAEMPQFRMLETVRGYIRTLLLSGGADRSRAEAAYVRTWLCFAQEVGSARLTHQEREMFDAFDQEFDNVLAAVRVAARTDTAAARKLLALIWRVCVRRGHIGDWIALVESCLMDTESITTPEHVSLLAAASEVYRSAARYTSARQFGEKAVSCNSPDPSAAVSAHHALCCAYFTQGEVRLGMEQLELAEKIASTHSDEAVQIDIQILRATILNRAGKYDDASRYANLAYSLCRQRAAVLPIQLVGNLALSRRFSGDLEGARDLYRSAAKRCKSEREERAEAIMLLDQAECEMLVLELDAAEETLKTAQVVVENRGIALLECVVNQQKGALRVLRNEPDLACAELAQALNSNPAGSHHEQDDLTLIWYVHAELLAGRVDRAQSLARRLVSEVASVRRYLQPFVAESLATLLARAGDRHRAAQLTVAASRLRLREGIKASPAELLLYRTDASVYSPVDIGADEIESDDLLALCASAMGVPRTQIQ